MGAIMEYHRSQSDQPDFPGKTEHPDLAEALLRESLQMPVPEALDQRVADLAMPTTRPRHGWRITGLRVAAAAVVALGLGVLALLALPQAGTRHRLSAPLETALLVRDVNGDGTVDVLDALSLARQIECKDARAIDCNGDGDVDADDVDHLMTMIVRIPTRGSDS